MVKFQVRQTAHEKLSIVRTETPRRTASCRLFSYSGALIWPVPDNAGIKLFSLSDPSLFVLPRDAAFSCAMKVKTTGSGLRNAI